MGSPWNIRTASTQQAVLYLPTCTTTTPPCTIAPAPCAVVRCLLHGSQRARTGRLGITGSGQGSGKNREVELHSLVVQAPATLDRHTVVVAPVACRAIRQCALGTPWVGIYAKLVCERPWRPCSFCVEGGTRSVEGGSRGIEGNPEKEGGRSWMGRGHEAR